MSSDNDRWQRLGITLDDRSGPYRQLESNCRQILDEVKAYPNIPKEWSVSAVIGDLVIDGCFDGVITHLGLRDDVSQLGLRNAERAADVSVDYFYGEWRDGYEELHGYSADELDWIDIYRPAVMLAACLDREAVLEKLFAWPSYDAYSNEGAFDLKPADVRFYLIVAATMRGDDREQIAELEEAVQNQRRRAPKLLVSAFRAIREGDQTSFNTALEEYLKDRRRRHLRPRDVWTVFSLEGTLLYHLARRASMSPPPLAEELQDLIVTRESLGGRP